MILTDFELISFCSVDHGTRPHHIFFFFDARYNKSWCSNLLLVSYPVGIYDHFSLNFYVNVQFIRSNIAGATLQMFPEDELIYLVHDNARPHVRAQLPDGDNHNIET